MSTPLDVRKDAAQASLVDAKPEVMWLDNPLRPIPTEPLRGTITADLAVVGGGYTGLWTALLAKERDPGLDVVVLEAGDCGWQASGRNGGFVAASLTHGFSNGLERWPDELAQMDRMGAENLDAIEASIAKYDIDCNWERTGELDVATRTHEVDGLREYYEAMLRGRPRGGVARPGGGAGQGRLTDVPRRSARFRAASRW